MDKIKIKTDNDEIIEMEVVLTYKNRDKDYVIYKDQENVHYIAKYNYSNDELDTDLTEEEITFGEQVLNEVINEISSK